MSLQLTAPQPLVATHLLDGFECGEAVLDEWLGSRLSIAPRVSNLAHPCCKTLSTG
ncbi:hypothetical protein CARN8_4140002 [mine drainage metagenome]|uniref:Uncharacterized protein n=1 Tax=mine drainage metagenome TaxID=410659 RepID=A0A3P3ZQB1_9ZZZZ